MIPYGKSAPGLAEDLGIPVGITELIASYPDESDNYIKNNDISYNDWCKTYSYGKKPNNLTKKGFLKDEHKLGLFLPEIVTADDLIRKYFETFPGIKDFLEDNGRFAKQYCYVKTPDVFGRVRFFSPPEDGGEEAAIQRAGQNMPIQSSSANITKYAAVLIDKHIDENNLNDQVKFLGFLHDELWYACKEEIAEEWNQTQCRLMEKAAEVVLGHELLKVEGDIYWDKKWHK